MEGTRPGVKCWRWFCKEEALCQCPFCEVAFCEKHGTKTKYDAWPFEKFKNNVPYKFWPCDMCDRKLRNNAEFIDLCGGPEQFTVTLKAFLEAWPDEELAKGLGVPKRTKVKAEDVSFKCKICKENITLSRFAKQTGKGSFHALASPIYGGIGVSLLGPFGVFLGFILGGMASVNSFKGMTVCGTCCATCEKSNHDCSCNSESSTITTPILDSIPRPSSDSEGSIGSDGKEWITFPPNSQNHFYRTPGDTEWIYFVPG